MEQQLRPSGHYVLDELSAVDIMMSFPTEVAMSQGRGAKLPKLAAFVDWMHNRDAFKRSVEKGGAYRFS
jgi:glutathione S-transferase